MRQTDKDMPTGVMTEELGGQRIPLMVCPRLLLSKHHGSFKCTRSRAAANIDRTLDAVDR